jgi:transposase
MPYLPEDVYAELRRLSRFKDQLSEDRIRVINRLHREMAIYFPEYKDAFGKIESAFALEVLKEAPFPEDILAIGADGLRDIWRRAGLKGRGYGRAGKIVDLASGSVGLVHGTQGGRKAVRWSAAELERLNGEIADTEEMLHTRCREIPCASNVLEIRGIGENILCGILSEMGDISRFDDAKEIQKMSGLSLVSSSSGKHKGDTKISRRGRKRLRYWLFQAARSSIAYADEFKALHIYYTTRKENPLKKMQSLIVIACKLLRIIYMLLRTGRSYDPSRMLGDIHRPAEKTSVA